MTLRLPPSILLNPNGATRLGSDPTCKAYLNHPLVASQHAEVVLGQGEPHLTDLGTGTFVNGQKVLGRRIDLQVGDRIDIGPFAFQFTGKQLEAAASMDAVQLTARGLSRTVPARGGDRLILRNISLVIPPGKFVCLLGPSGCGKSTLMAVLSGRERPTAGQVRINHRDLHTQFELVKQHLVLVPQKPLLHRDLTVDEALSYTARLRLPQSTNRAQRVTEMIEDVKLKKEDRRQLISKLSGGQEKRASLANELISGPGIIFLDEVTSGLDENTDGEMMRRFQYLARDKGKTIVCITHSLVHVPETCDLVIFLAPGGRLVYYGPPDHALRYFNVHRLGDVYDLLTEPNADRLAQEFANSSEYATYIESLLPPEDTSPTPSTRRRARVWLPGEALTVLMQTLLLTMRQLRQMPRDLAAMAGLLGQVFLVALILILAFEKIPSFPPIPQKEIDNEKKIRAHGVTDSQIKEIEETYAPRSVITRSDYVRKLMNLSFLLAVTSFWFGCNNAAKEIVRERAITTQERLFNLRATGYYLSKLLILTILSWLQVSLLLALVWYWCAPPGNLQAHLPILLALALTGTTLGLLLSSISPTENVAVTLIPIAVIPQIVLSGAIVKLTGAANTLGWLTITTYWGKRGMDALMLGEAGEFARRPEVSLIDADGIGIPLGYILAHAVLFAGLTLAALSTNWTLSVVGDKIKATWKRRFRFGS